MGRIRLHEVGPRDGLQIEAAIVPTDTKERWIRALASCGLDMVQVGSFVHPARVPQMADTDELFRRLLADPPPGARLSGLVLNEKGLERALACGVPLICMGVSASETHSRRNTGMGTDEALGRILAMAHSARAAGRQVQVSVQSAFGCGFDGPIPPSRVLAIVDRYLEAGFRQISLADTAGHACPPQVERLFAEILRRDPEADCACHFHNTYGLGMANIYAALRTGVTLVETSMAGLGGCPFTKVAAGNVATEDFVHALQRDGQRLDIDLQGLIALAREAAATFGRALEGYVYKTGPIAPAERP